MPDNPGVSLDLLKGEPLFGVDDEEDTPLMTTRRIARGDVQVPSFVSEEATDMIKKVSGLDLWQYLLGGN